MKAITIKPEFEKLIPALSKDELEQLEKNILEEGIRDPLVIWNETLIDGHNRYKLATKHNLNYEVFEKKFDSEDDVKIWMIDNQKGRRNLAEFVMYELQQIRSAILNKKGEQIRINKAIIREAEKRGEEPVLSIIDKTGIEEKHDTRAIIANNLGWSTGKVAMADVVSKKAPDEIKEKLRTNEMTISQAYKEIKKEEKKEEVRAKEETYQQEIKEVSNFEVDIFNTDKKFNIIYADPAWGYWEGGEKNQSLHYSTMSIDEIKNLPVKNIADDNCILFIWVTFPILKESLEVIDAWGFKYSTCGFNWVKKNKNADSYFFGNGAWTRANSELCLIATKGSITRMDASISQILDDKIGEHSAKPKRVRSLITKLVGELPRIELFSRNEMNDGWFNWGNQI
jgi:N6-adenosine-specific RNA methylase IME4